MRTRRRDHVRRPPGGARLALIVVQGLSAGALLGMVVVRLF